MSIQATVVYRLTKLKVRYRYTCDIRVCIFSVWRNESLSKENLLLYQLHSSGAIMYVILVTALFLKYHWCNKEKYDADHFLTDSVKRLEGGRCVQEY